MFKDRAIAIEDAAKDLSIDTIKGESVLLGRHYLRKRIDESARGTAAHDIIQDVKDKLVPLDLDKSVDLEGLNELVEKLKACTDPDQRDVHGAKTINFDLGL